MTYFYKVTIHADNKTFELTHDKPMSEVQFGLTMKKALVELGQRGFRRIIYKITTQDTVH